MTPAETRIVTALQELAHAHGFKLVPLAALAAPAPPIPASGPDPWPKERVRAVRLALGLSQRELARRLGMPGENAFTTISKFENGRDRLSDRYRPLYTSLEEEARQKVRSETPAPAVQPAAAAAAPAIVLGKPLRRREACGCERIFSSDGPKEGRPVRLCGAHGWRPKYQPSPPRSAPRPPKPPTVPLPRAVGPGDVLCSCRHPARDHDERRFRCYVCGTGHGGGCQIFRAAAGSKDA